MEYSRVEKFQMSSNFTASTLSHNGTEEEIHKSRKPTKVLRRSSSLLETRLMNCSNKSDDTNLALNLCPDGSIIINEAVLTATKFSLNAITASFIVQTNYQESDAHTPIKHFAPRPPLEPSLVAVVTTHGYPLHVTLEDSPCVKATHSLSKLNYY